METGISEDLASILDGPILMDGPSNYRMREFFTKLIQTDAQIRKLKQSISNNYQIDNLKTITDRFKRSNQKVKRKRFVRFKGNTKVTKHVKNVTSEEKTTRKENNKRSVTHNNDNGLGITGYVIKSEEVVVRYDTDKRRNFPKCSHSHEDKSHEKKLKHPFYKHSQRVDEMLNYKKPDEKTENFEVIYGNYKDEPLKTTTPDIDASDEVTIIEFMKKTTKNKPLDEEYQIKQKYQEKVNNIECVYKVDYKRNNVSTKTYVDNTKKMENAYENYENRNNNEKGLLNDYDRSFKVLQYTTFELRNDGDKKANTSHNDYYASTTESTMKEKDASNYFDYYNMDKVSPSAPLYDVALSVATFINPMDKPRLKSKMPRNHYMGQRVLLQVEDDDQEDLGYEDLKEVLTDDKEGHDDFDGHVDRKKRDYEEKVGIPENFNPNQNNRLNVYNKNWKGPMPLYPDELNSMIRQAALENLYMQTPLNTKDNKVETDLDENDVSDTQYIEDYSANKYNKMAGMAQAYSDYGVLYNKKENQNENNKGVNRSKFNKIFNKQKLFGRSDTKKGSLSAFDSEGFKFGLKNGTATNNQDFLQGIKKHIKLCGNSHGSRTTTLNPVNNLNFEIDKLLTLTHLPDTKDMPTTKSNANTTPNRFIVLSFKKGSRTLKSINTSYEDDNAINKERNPNLLGKERDLLHESSILDMYEMYDIINETTASSLSEDYYGRDNKTTNTYHDIIKDTSESVIKEISKKIYDDWFESRNTSTFDVMKILRGLKSVVETGEDKSDKILHKKGNDTNISKYSLDKVNDTLNDTRNNNNTTDGIISFISMVSDWFRILANLSGETKNEDFEHESKRSSAVLYNLTKQKTKKKKLEQNVTKDFLYPSSEVEMVDNIGHRSRVLMSIDKNSTKGEIDDVVQIALAVAVNNSIQAEPKTDINKENKNNKTVVKRSLADNLVFWNDLYDDDEYGIKLDYNDNVRDKHSVKKVSNILNKSRDWLQDKFSNFKNNFYLKRKNKCRSNNTTYIKKHANEAQLVKTPEAVLKERNVRDINHNGNVNTKITFAALTANMKKVCHEAAKAIQDTRNIEVRENTKETAAATSLMQQLVQLMSELVDIQVQQKTCAKLPSDLYNFLEWLTAPPDDSIRIDDWTPITTDYDDAMRFEKSTEQILELPTSFTEDTHQDDRTECLGTIRAVQDLIQQYEGMTDEDKSKMAGVREYLENQLQYLNTKLNYLYESYPFKLVKKREIPRKRRRSKKLNKNKVIANVNTTEISAIGKFSKSKVKRNWRDVYFKAVEDSKKTTVVKDKP